MDEDQADHRAVLAEIRDNAAANLGAFPGECVHAEHGSAWTEIEERRGVDVG